MNINIYLDLLVRAVDHGNEHVEKDDHHGDVVDPVQDVTNVLDEFMVILQHHRDHFWQAKDGPEKSLKTLLHSVMIERKVVKKRGCEPYKTSNIYF